MVRSREEAMEASLRTTRNTPNTCQLMTRGWFGSASVGDVDGDGDADAVDGWKSEPESSKHRGDRNPPPGVPLAFSGGSKGFGHRCISHKGIARSTDMLEGRYSSGNTGFATIEQIERSMGVRYEGWSETIGGVPIPFTSAKPEKVESTRLRVFDHNAYVGQKPEHYRKHLRVMIANEQPDIIVISEAKNLFGHLNGLGYKVHQLKPRNRASANIAVLVREDLKIKKSLVMRMTESWTGPKAGVKQPPRVYRAVNVKKGPFVWKVGGFHIPFGADSRAESFDRIKKWFRNSATGRPTIAVNDFNMKKAEVEKQLRGLNVKVEGSGIMLAIYKNCDLIKTKSLGLMGSDVHHAKLHVFEKKHKK